MNPNAYAYRGCSLDNFASTKYIFSPQRRNRSGLFIVFPNRHYTEYLTLRLLKALAGMFFRPGHH